MKKFLSCLLIVVLIVSLSISLISCGDADELKGLSYIDENGNEVTVKKIKKTDDADKVTAAIMALANKEVDTSALSNLMLSLTASGSASGTQDDVAFTDNISANLSVGVAFPEDTTDMAMSDLILASKFYVGGSVSGKVPKNLFTDEDDKVLTLNDTMDINESISAYLDAGVLYAKGDLSETATAAMADYADLIAKINGKYGKFDTSSMLPLVDTIVGGKGGKEKSAEYVALGTSVLRDSKNSLAKIVTKLTEEDEEDAGEEAEEEEEFEFTYANVKTIVQAFNIKIVKTKGSKVTFTADINKNSIATLEAAFGDEDDEEDADEEDEKVYDGNVHVELVLDAKTMLDCTITATATKVAEFITDAEDFPGVTFTDSSISVTLTLSTAAIPTISEADAESATEITLMEIASLIM